MSLTKYNTMLGMQCKKALWLDAHQPELKEPLSESDLLRFELGNAVDKEAQHHYGNGIEVKAADWLPAVNRTKEFIEGGAKRLYQPAFEHNGLRIRSDILDFNADGSCVLREIKMSTSKKDEHVQDIALQIYVLQGSGLYVGEALLVTVDKEYIAGSSTPLFIEHNVTAEAEALIVQLENLLSGHQEVLGLENEPTIAIGPHCTKPWICAFKSYCWQDVPEDSIFTVPRLQAKKKTQLLEQQIHRVAEIPDDFPLSEKQRAYVSLIKIGEDQTDKAAIQEALNALPKPFYFLDFETFATPFPFWTGIKPNHQVPFQYSCHRLDENDELSHHAFLHTSLEDPRPAIITSLLSWIGSTGSIMVYNASFERRVLELLAVSAPDQAPQLNAMIGRLYDQLDLVKAHVAHPGLLGSNSLKKVSEVILSDVIDFKALDIGDGASAQAGWYKMVNSPEAERDALAAALEAYCVLDTRAQVELHKWFVK